MDRSAQIDTFSRFTRVSRETITSLIEYENMLINANKKLNLIGKSTINNIWTRHFLDSFQVIDFINENDKNIIDLGSGAGFPGLVVALAAKERKFPLKTKLLEKSIKKAEFLKKVINKFNLNVEVICENIFDQSKFINEDVIVARAFKPIEKIFELIHNKGKNWKKLIIFLGKTGKSELLQASKIWDIKYKQVVSVTNMDSLIININSLKKIN